MRNQTGSSRSRLRVAALVVALAVGGPCASGATDSASDPAYAAEAGGAWKGTYALAGTPSPEENPPGTDNGGAGFGPWDFSWGYHVSALSPYGTTNHFIDGVDFPASTYNDLGGPAFGLTNFNGDYATTTATRPFAAPMSVGDVFSVNFDSPATYSTTGNEFFTYPFAIIQFIDAAGQKTFDIEAGKNALWGEFPWRYDHAGGTDVYTGIDPDATSDGSALSFELTSPTAGNLTFDRGGPDQQVIPISLLNAAPVGVSFTVNFCDSSNLTGEYEFFFNDLVIAPGNEWQKSAAGSTSGNWGDAAQWKSGTVPDAVDATANFFGHASIDGNPTVNVDAPRLVGKINFENASYSYTLTGSNGITLDVTSGEAQINVNSGSHAIDAPLTLADDTIVTVAPANASLTVSNVQNSTAKLTKAGAGTLSFPGTLGYTGGTVVNAGTLQVSRLHENNAVTINAGTLRVLESAPGLSSGHPAGDNAMVSRPSSLSIEPGATLDLTNNDLILDYTGASPIAAYEALVASGYNVIGDWAGDGITSSVAAVDGNYVLAIADNAALPAPFGTAQGGSLFAGVDVDLDTILIKFTHRADINLDGLITPDDSAIFGGNYDETQPATWATGDMNYDGRFTPDDAAIFGGAYDDTLISLPEPACLGTVIFAGLVAVRRSRR